MSEETKKTAFSRPLKEGTDENAKTEVQPSENRDTTGKLIPSNVADPNPLPPATPSVHKEKDEGTYQKPEDIKPNPNPERHPNQNQPESVIPRADLVAGNQNQVYPEHSFGTTPTDPDIRENAKKGDTKEDQTAQMVRRRSKDFPEDKVPLDAPSKGAEDLQKNVTTRPEPESPTQPTFKTGGGLTSLKKGVVYRIRGDQNGSTWWKRKYDGLPAIVVEGTVEDVLGVKYGDRALFGHYLSQEFQQRQETHPAGHPILKNTDTNLYVGEVYGRRVLVHGYEVETDPGEKELQDLARKDAEKK